MGPFTQPINSSVLGYVRHSQAIDAALPRDYRGIVAGWKDNVLTRDCWSKPGKKTNYGWHWLLSRTDAPPAPIRPSLTVPSLGVIQLDHEAHGAGASTDWPGSNGTS